MKHVIKQLLWPIVRVFRRFFYQLMRDVVDSQKAENESTRLLIDDLKAGEQKQFLEINKALEQMEMRLNSIDNNALEFSAETKEFTDSLFGLCQTSFSSQNEFIESKFETIENMVLECNKEVKSSGERLSEVYQSTFSGQIDCIKTEIKQTNDSVKEASGEVLEAIERVVTLNCRTIHDVNKGFFELDFQRTHPVIEETNSHEVYNDAFYNNNRYDSFTSARRVLEPIIKRLNVKSIIDFGCGTGTWLFAAEMLSVNKVYGIDGDYINRSMLLIDENDFHAHDLTAPIECPEKYDLAISMEVGEHLPPEASSTYIKSICSSSDLVLFSAAHVGQGGDRHINEQPFSFWNKLFMENGYKHLEIRPFFSGDWEIESWYRDNMGIFVREEAYAHVSDVLSEIVE